MPPSHPYVLEKHAIDPNVLAVQQELACNPSLFDPPPHFPFNDFDDSGNSENRFFGQKLIENGELGCLVLAGGQGTRLKATGPKGCYPISLIKNKSLFQLLAEKVKAASVLAKRPLKLAVMTSKENDLETKTFFKNHDFFGLETSQVDFFIQGELPFLTDQGELFYKKENELMMGPDGNGSSLIEFVKSGVWKKWKESGITSLHVVLIDNPLVDPFDAELIGYHKKHALDATLKCTKKSEPHEKVGVVVSFEKGQVGVVEYSELSEKEKEARREDGLLTYGCANLSLFCFSMDFIKKLEEEKKAIPLHKAWKEATMIDSKGVSSKIMAWKFETFIFDWLSYANNVRVLLYPRKECFAPLKNFSGADSPTTVKEALLERDRIALKALTGLPAPNFPFELPADFYYPTTEMKEKWAGKVLDTAYPDP